MSKTDKELAVELTVATMNMVTHHKLPTGAPSANILKQSEVIQIMDNFYKTIKNLDNSEN